MRKLSIVCLWAFIIFLSLGVLVWIFATILQFVNGDIASGFSDFLWTCIVGAVLAATIGIMANEKKGGEQE